MRKLMWAAALAAFMMTAPAVAAQKDCATFEAYNGKLHAAFGVQPFPFAVVGMKHIPCHCIPVSARMDRVYRKPQPGMVCGNGWFYDKQCHEGLSCAAELGAR